MGSTVVHFTFVNDSKLTLRGESMWLFVCLSCDGLVNCPGSPRVMWDRLHGWMNGHLCRLYCRDRNGLLLQIFLSVPDHFMVCFSNHVD